MSTSGGAGTRLPEHSTRTRLFLAYPKRTFRGRVATRTQPEPDCTIRQIPDYLNWSKKALFQLMFLENCRFFDISEFFFSFLE